MAPEIFVVDNESDIRRLVKVCLEAAVFEVRTAANGTEMRRLFADRAPDLALLD